jgi:hypothetical protein
LYAANEGDVVIPGDKIFINGSVVFTSFCKCEFTRETPVPIAALESLSTKNLVCNGIDIPRATGKRHEGELQAGALALLHRGTWQKSIFISIDQTRPNR